MINIEEMLEKYKSNRSQLELLECKMQRKENEIQLLDPSYISAVQYSDMPKSKTNKFSSVVENTVIETELNKEEANRLKGELWDMASEHFDLKLKVKEVNALLEGLTEEERFVIEQFYINDVTWRIVAERYCKEFGIYISKTPLKNKRDNAFEKMEQNAGITNSKKSQKRPELVRY